VAPEWVGKPPTIDTIPEIPMTTTTINALTAVQADHAFGEHLSLEAVRHRAPAVFAENAAARVTRAYRFISTSQVVGALVEAGFVPTDARQGRSKAGDSAGYARHLIRFRHARESVTLVDAIPEIVLVNAHDGTSAYQLRAGLFRPLCTNGLIARIGDFGFISVPHRASVVADVVEGALRLTAQFQALGGTVRAMAHRVLSPLERLGFAEAALGIRYPHADRLPYAADRVLEARRSGDAGDSLWQVYNVVQENLMRGGIAYQSARGRAMRTRRIGAIREDVRINTGLWQAAAALLEPA
jgi:hypothetical protein